MSRDGHPHPAIVANATAIADRSGHMPSSLEWRRLYRDAYADIAGDEAQEYLRRLNADLDYDERLERIVRLGLDLDTFRANARRVFGSRVRVVAPGELKSNDHVWPPARIITQGTPMRITGASFG